MLGVGASLQTLPKSQQQGRCFGEHTTYRVMVMALNLEAGK